MNLLLDTCPLLWALEPTTEDQPAAARTAARSAQSGMGQRRERLGVAIKGDRDSGNRQSTDTGGGLFAGR